MITVKADAGKFVFGNMAEEMITDNASGPFEYLADALATIAIITAYAEKKYGPLVTDALLRSMEKGTLRATIEEAREKSDVQHSDEDGQSH